MDFEFYLESPDGKKAIDHEDLFKAQLKTKGLDIGNMARRLKLVGISLALARLQDLYL